MGSSLIKGERREEKGREGKDAVSRVMGRVVKGGRREDAGREKVGKGRQPKKS